MRKPALAITAACVIASLLFFVAPVFRQAFRVSLLPWGFVFKTDHSRLSPELRSIMEKAGRDHDAEALAFVSFQHPEAAEAARLADEAVRLDPNLVWVYAIVAAREPLLPEIDRWVPALERFDPQNALPHLIVAEKIDIDQVLPEKPPSRVVDEPPAAWQSAMAAAFKSPKLDTYSSRRKELYRRVLNHYYVGDPELITDDDWFYGLPSYGVSDSFRYAELVLASAQADEAQGDNKAASKKYLTVAHFGKLVSSYASGWALEYTEQAYTRLATLAAKSSRPEEASFYGFLADQERQSAAHGPSSRYWRSRNNQIARWDADLVRRAGTVMLLSGALLLATLFAVLLRGRSLRLSSLRPGRLAIGLGASSSAVFLVSSVVLRLSYQPYAEILRRYLHNGDETGLTDLRDFLGDAYASLGAGWLNPKQDYESFFWFAVIVLCAAALLVAILRYFQTHRRASATM